MTRDRAKELAPIIAAYGEGKRVQYYGSHNDLWVDCPEPVWNEAIQYRIAPEPRRRPMTRDEVLDFLAEHPNALVRVRQWEWKLPGTYDYDKPSEYSYCLVTNGVRSEPRKFEIEEDNDE